MPKYTLTIEADNVAEIMQAITPQLIANIKTGILNTDNPAKKTQKQEVSNAASPEVQTAPVEAAPAKRGRKPKAVEAVKEEPAKNTEPSEMEPAPEKKAEDFSEFGGATPEFTVQQVSDKAVQVGQKFGRAVMVSVFKANGGEKLAMVPKEKYGNVISTFEKLLDPETTDATRKELGV